MNAKTMIAIVATLAMLFAGVAVVDSDSEVYATAGPVEFHVGEEEAEKVYWFNHDGSATITLPKLSDLNATDLPAGQQFVGWMVSTAVGADDPCYPAGTTIAHESGTKYVAKLVPIKYTATFVDGEKAPVALPGEYNAQLTAPEVTPADGYVFAGWFDGEGKLVIDADRHFNIKATATYTAKYIVDPVITFVVDGITIYEKVQSKLVYPSDPAKDDFEFLGWAVDKDVVIDAGIVDGKKAVTDLGLEKATVFTAVFEPALHTVVFTVDGVTVSTQTVKHGESAVEPAFIPAKDGFDFAGWDFDFKSAVLADTTIVATFTETVEPEPEGLDDPVTQTVVILGGLLAIILLAVLISKVRKGEIVIGRGPNAKKKKDKEDEE